MKVRDCIEVLNPYDWLPGYGENSVDLYLIEGNLSMVIKYDDKNGGPGKKIIQFKDVCALHKSSVPGVEISNLCYNGKWDGRLGSLLEFPDSAAALAWRLFFENTRQVKHYCIYFFAENIRVDVFGGNVAIKSDG